MITSTLEPGRDNWRYLYYPGQLKRALRLRLGVRKAIPISHYQHDFGVMGSGTGRLHAKGAPRFTSKLGSVVKNLAFVMK